MSIPSQNNDQDPLLQDNPSLVASMIAMGFTPQQILVKLQGLDADKREQMEQQVEQNGDMADLFRGWLRTMGADQDWGSTPSDANGFTSQEINYPPQLRPASYASQPGHAGTVAPVMNGTGTGPVRVDNSIPSTMRMASYSGTFGAGLGTDKVHADGVARAVAAHDRNKPPGWEAMVQKVKGLTGVAQLEMANKLITQMMPYAGNHASDGPWVFSPGESMACGVHNCRELGLAKLLLLRDAGVDIRNMALASLPDANGHIVPVVKMADGQQYIMDLGWRSGTPARVLNVADIGSDPVLRNFPNPVRMTPLSGDTSPTMVASATPSPTAKPKPPVALRA